MQVDLSLVVGLGGFGEEVSTSIRQYKEYLPECLNAAWTILELEFSAPDKNETIENAKERLLDSRNLSKIESAGYIIGGRAQQAITVVNIYLWSHHEYRDLHTFPTIITERVRLFPDELHIAFCLEDDSNMLEDRDISGQKPPSLKLYLLGRRLATKEILNREDMLSSISSAILSAFMPNIEFDLHARPNEISAIGFAGKYGMIWAAHEYLYSMLGKRIAKTLLERIFSDRGGDDAILYSELVKSNAFGYLFPENILKGLFALDDSSISDSPNIPARPHLEGETELSVKLDERQFTNVFRGHTPSEWARYIERAALTFRDTLSMQWRNLLVDRSKKIVHYLIETIPRCQELLDNSPYAPAICRRIFDHSKKALNSLPNLASKPPAASVDDALDKLRDCIHSIPNMGISLLRTLIWVLPANAILAMILIRLQICPNEICGYAIAFILSLALMLMFYIKYRSARNECISDALKYAKQALSALRQVQERFLAEATLKELSDIASTAQGTLNQCDNLVQIYISNIEDYLNNMELRMNDLDIAGDFGLRPLLSSRDMYTSLLDTLIGDRIFALLEELFSSGVMTEMHSASHDVDILDSSIREHIDSSHSLHNALMNLYDLECLLLKLYGVDSLKDILDKYLEEMHRISVPMTNRNSQSTEIIFLVPSSLHEYVASIDHINGEEQYSVCSTDDWPLLLCITRSYIPLALNE